MHNNLFLFALLFACCFSFAQTIWTGPKMTFQKEGNDDPLLAEFQDRITPLVWITRGRDNVLFNAKTQGEVDASTQGYGSPEDTEWAEGTTENLSSLTFSDFKNAAPKVSGVPKVKQMAGKDYVLHLITDDVYIDLKILSWENQRQGGGFSYERSTNQNLSTDAVVHEKNIKLYPNPTSSYLKVVGIKKTISFNIYSILGTKLLEGNISSAEKIDVQPLKKGVYFISLGNGQTLRFVKNQ